SAVSFFFVKDKIKGGCLRIFLAKGISFIGDQRQAVGVGVGYDAQIAVVLFYEFAKILQMLWKRLGIVSKKSVRLLINHVDLRNAQRFQHSPNRHATGTVNGINSDRKILRCNELAIDIRQLQDLLDVIIQCFGIRLHRTYLVIFFILIALLLAYLDNFLTFFSIKKLTFTIEQLQCIPFRRIMAGRDDNGTVGLVFKYGHGYRRR